MKRLLSVIVLSLSAFGSGIDAIVISRSDDWLWRDGKEVDELGSLLALQVLSRHQEYAVEVLASRMAMLREVSEDILWGDLAKDILHSDGEYSNIEKHSHEGGFSFETDGWPDILSTAWGLFFLAENKAESDLVGNAVGFLRREIEENDNLRMRLLGACVITKLRYCTVFSEAIEYSKEILNAVKNNEYRGCQNFEYALCLGILCHIGDWEEAFRVRRILLESELEKGGWGEADGLEFDLVTTCLVQDALDCFEIDEFDCPVNFQLTDMANSLQLSDGNFSMKSIVFNDSSFPIENGAVSVLAVLSDGNVELICEENVNWLSAKRSSKVELAGKLPENCSGIVLALDANAGLQDLNRADNFVYFPLTQEVVPCIAWLGVDGGEDLLFLAAGRGVHAGAYILHNGHGEYRWLDNGEVIGAGMLNNKSTSEYVELEWFPNPGEHILTIEIGDGDEWQHRSVEVLVAYDAAIVRCVSLSSEGEEYCNEFMAREYVGLKPQSSYSGSDIRIAVYDSEGKQCGKAVRDEASGLFLWHTSINAPGMYVAEATFWNGSLLLTTAQASFSIVPTARNEKLQILSPGGTIRLYEGEAWSPEIVATWEASANVHDSVSLGWKILNSDFTDYTEHKELGVFELDLSTLYQRLEYNQTALRFSSAGNYIYRLELKTNEHVITADMPLLVLPKPVVSVENYLTSRKVPAGFAYVDNVLRLSVDGELVDGLPESFALEHEPLEVEDIQGDKISVNLVDIEDSNGRCVSSGKLGFVVKYGRMTGQNGLSEMRTEGDAVTAEIVDGRCEMVYFPTGGILEENDNATVVIWVYQVENGSLGKKIGNIDVMLSRSESLLEK